MKYMGRIHTATYGAVLALLMFAYVTCASAKPAVHSQTHTVQSYSWADNFYNEGLAYEK